MLFLMSPQFLVSHNLAKLLFTKFTLFVSVGSSVLVIISDHIRLVFLFVYCMIISPKSSSELSKLDGVLFRKSLVATVVKDNCCIPVVIDDK